MSILLVGITIASFPFSLSQSPMKKPTILFRATKIPKDRTFLDYLKVNQNILSFPW